MASIVDYSGCETSFRTPTSVRKASNVKGGNMRIPGIRGWEEKLTSRNVLALRRKTPESYAKHADVLSCFPFLAAMRRRTSIFLTNADLLISILPHSSSGSERVVLAWLPLLASFCGFGLAAPRFSRPCHSVHVSFPGLHRSC